MAIPHPVRTLVEIDRAWRARTASDALRDASDLLGRGYLRLGTRLWDLGALGGRTWCRPVVLGVMAGEAGLDSGQTARLVGFEDVQTAIAAALKLRPFDPAVGAAWSMAAAASGRGHGRPGSPGSETRTTSLRTRPHSSSTGPSSTSTARGGCSVPDFPIKASAGSKRAAARADLRLGVAGPVGTGKSSLIALLCRELGGQLSIGVITNDIYTDEDARFLRSAGVLDPERIRAVETGACPHTAIRDDVTQNLIAVEDLEHDFAPLDLVLVESGGDNLTATFSPALVDAQFFVLDVAGGGDVARKGGPGHRAAPTS